jgi:hypothetical protein
LDSHGRRATREQATTCSDQAVSYSRKWLPLAATTIVGSSMAFLDGARSRMSLMLDEASLPFQTSRRCLRAKEA